MDTAIGVFSQISIRIIKEQEAIIGPLAWSEAAKVQGLTILDTKTPAVTIVGDPKLIINNLVARYEKLFGRLSRDICREAVVDLTAEIPAEEIPSSLK